MFTLDYYNRYNTRIVVSTDPIDATGAISDIVLADLTSNKVLVSSAAGKVAASTTASSKLAYLDNVTSDIQAQIDAIAAPTTGDVTEVTSNILSFTGETDAVLGAGLAITVQQATGAQPGYLSSTDWNTFNNKLGTALADGKVWIGDGGDVAAARTPSGDATISNLGVVAITADVIVNADINSAAAIAFSKMEALTASKVPVLDASGFITASAVSTTALGYISTLSSAAQTQIDTKLTVNLTTPAEGDIVYYDGAEWVNLALGTNGQVLSSNGTTVAWASGASNGLPSGGTAAQVLTKVDGTDYNTTWSTLTAALITDVTATAAQINVLATGFYDAGSSIQTQLNNKLDGLITRNYFLIGNSSGEAVESTDLPTGTTIGTNYIYRSGGTDVIPADGGTGISSYTVGDILYASGAAALSKLAAGTSGYVLTAAGAGVAPEWAAPAGVLSGLTSPRIPFAASATTLSDSANLYWDDSNDVLYFNNGFGIKSVFSYDNLYMGHINAAQIASTGLDNFSVLGLQKITTGDGNIGIGNLTLGEITTESYNIAMGYLTAPLLTGHSNIVLGSNSGSLMTTADYNTIVGVAAGAALTTGDNNLLLGARLEFQSNTASDQLTIQNAIFGQGNSAISTTMSAGVIGLYTVAAIGSWSKATFIGNVATESTAITNGIVVYAKDSSDGAANSTLAIYTEQSVEAIGTYTPSHKLKVWINGTEYWIELDAV